MPPPVVTPASNPKKRKPVSKKRKTITLAEVDELKFNNETLLKANTKLQSKVVRLTKEKEAKEEEFDAFKTKSEREIFKRDMRLMSHDTQVNNLRNQLENAKETKTVLKAKVIADRVAIESQLAAERDVARAQLAEIRTECKRVYNDKAATKSQYEARETLLREVQLQNTRLGEENTWYKSQIKTKDDTIASQRKAIDTLQKECAILRDQKHDKMIKQKELSIHGKELDLLIEDKKTNKGVAIKSAKKDRMTFVEEKRTSLKVDFAKKKKADQERAALKKQEDNNKKLQAHMLSNTSSPFTSLHYTMNRYNPAHGQFMNRRQLDEVSNGKRYGEITEYTRTYISILCFRASNMACRAVNTMRI